MGAASSYLERFWEGSTSCNALALVYQVAEQTKQKLVGDIKFRVGECKPVEKSYSKYLNDT